MVMFVMHYIFGPDSMVYDVCDDEKLLSGTSTP